MLPIQALTHKPGIIFQVSSESMLTWNLAINNVINLEKSIYPKRIRIEIVVLGRAVHNLTKRSPLARRIHLITQTGVTIYAGTHSLRAYSIQPSTLLAGVRLVTSGIAEIVRRERQGWVYVRP